MAAAGEPDGSVVKAQKSSKSDSSEEKDSLTIVLHSLSHDTCPEGYIAVTPKLVCRPIRTFNVPIEIKLPTWVTVASEEEDILASVMYQGHGEAETITKVSLRNANQKIFFKSDRFGTFWAHIMRFAYNKIKISIEPEVFHDICGSFTTTFTYKSEMKKEICLWLSKQQSTFASFVLGELCVKDGDEITVTMSAEAVEDDSNFRFVPEKAFFVVNEEFIAYPEKALRLTIQPTPVAGQFIQFNYIISLNGRDRRHEFLMTWPRNEFTTEGEHSIMDEAD